MRAIVAGNITLEPQTAAHADEMFPVLIDPAIYEYENAAPPSVEWLRARFARLESRRSADGSEGWLNWVIRLPTGALAGYVQATVRQNGEAAIAYELGSAYWGSGVARRAVRAMISELVERHGTRRVLAVHKRANLRSHGLLLRLGFAEASPELRDAHPMDDDETLMYRDVGGIGNPTPEEPLP